MQTGQLPSACSSYWEKFFPVRQAKSLGNTGAVCKYRVFDNEHYKSFMFVRIYLGLLKEIFDFFLHLLFTVFVPLKHAYRTEIFV